MQVQQQEFCYSMYLASKLNLAEALSEELLCFGYEVAERPYAKDLDKFIQHFSLDELDAKILDLTWPEYKIKVTEFLKECVIELHAIVRDPNPKKHHLPEHGKTTGRRYVRVKKRGVVVDRSKLQFGVAASGGTAQRLKTAKLEEQFALAIAQFVDEFNINSTITSTYSKATCWSDVSVAEKSKILAKVELNVRNIRSESTLSQVRSTWSEWCKFIGDKTDDNNRSRKMYPTDIDYSDFLESRRAHGTTAIKQAHRHLTWYKNYFAWNQPTNIVGKKGLFKHTAPVRKEKSCIPPRAILAFVKGAATAVKDVDRQNNGAVVYSLLCSLRGSDAQKTKVNLDPSVQEPGYSLADVYESKVKGDPFKIRCSTDPIFGYDWSKALLEGYRKDPNRDHLFIAEDGSYITPQAATRVMKQLLKDAGIEKSIRDDITTHSTRRCLVTLGDLTKVPLGESQGFGIWLTKGESKMPGKYSDTRLIKVCDNVKRIFEHLNIYRSWRRDDFKSWTEQSFCSLFSNVSLLNKLKSRLSIEEQVMYDSANRGD